jgi:hypothetical protein
VKASTADGVAAVPLVGPTSDFLATATCKERRRPLSIARGSGRQFWRGDGQSRTGY